MTRLTDSMRPDRATRPGRRIPAVSTNRSRCPCQVIRASTASRVVPATSLTSTRSSRTRRFTSDDLPTFGRPTIATARSARSPGGPASHPAGRGPAPARQPRHDGVEQIADPEAVLGSDRHDRRDGQPMELLDALLRPAVVDLVHRQHDRTAGAADVRRYLLVRGNHAVPCRRSPGRSTEAASSARVP